MRCQNEGPWKQKRRGKARKEGDDDDDWSEVWFFNPERINQTSSPLPFHPPRTQFLPFSIQSFLYISPPPLPPLSKKMIFWTKMIMEFHNERIENQWVLEYRHTLHYFLITKRIKSRQKWIQFKFNLVFFSFFFVFFSTRQSIDFPPIINSFLNIVIVKKQERRQEGGKKKEEEKKRTERTK